MAKLNCHISVHEKDEVGNVVGSHIFGPADDLPEWVIEQITNPRVWAEAPATTAKHAVPARDIPKKAGPGASTEAWARYAQGKGKEVPEGASRDQIIAMLNESGVPTE